MLFTCFDVSLLYQLPGKIYYSDTAKSQVPLYLRSIVFTFTILFPIPKAEKKETFKNIFLQPKILYF